jgi:hypothetical protein
LGCIDFNWNVASEMGFSYDLVKSIGYSWYSRRIRNKLRNVKHYWEMANIILKNIKEILHERRKRNRLVARQAAFPR